MSEQPDIAVVEFLDSELSEEARTQLLAIIATQMEDPQEIPIPLDSPLGRVIQSKSDNA